MGFSSILVVLRSPCRGLFDLEGEVVGIMEAVGNTFDDLDLVVDTLDAAGVNVMPAVVQDPVSMAFELSGEACEFRMTVLPSDSTPLLERLSGPCGMPVAPDVLQEVLEPVQGAQSFVHGQDNL